VSPERVPERILAAVPDQQKGSQEAFRASQRHLWSVGLSGLEPLTSALSGEVVGVAQPPPTRRGRPVRSGLIHGVVGPLSSRTTSRQPVVTIELAVSVHPLSRSSDARSPGGSSLPSRSPTPWANGCNRWRTEGNETTTETKGDLCLIRSSPRPYRVGWRAVGLSRCVQRWPTQSQPVVTQLVTRRTEVVGQAVRLHRLFNPMPIWTNPIFCLRL
jgi:hypothetical protein